MDVQWPAVSVASDEGAPGWEKGEWQDEGDYTVHYRQPGAYARMWEGMQKDWTDIVQAYETDPGDFYNAYYYLDGHPIYWHFTPVVEGLPPNHVTLLEPGVGASGAIDIRVVREDDGKVTVDFETGKIEFFQNEHGFHEQYHDYKADTQATTFERGIVALAAQVHKLYGNDRQKCEDGADLPG